MIEFLIDALVIHNCSLLMVCMMSHGSVGSLQAGDGNSTQINSILHQLKEKLPPKIPLVRRLGISLCPIQSWCYTWNGQAGTWSRVVNFRRSLIWLYENFYMLKFVKFWYMSQILMSPTLIFLGVRMLKFPPANTFLLYSDIFEL